MVPGSENPNDEHVPKLQQPAKEKTKHADRIGLKQRT